MTSAPPVAAESDIRDFSLPYCDLNDKHILITGGTGSFGSAFVRSIVKTCTPKRLIIFSRDEMKQYEMQQWPELQNLSYLRFFIGDVRDVGRLEMAMRDVDYVLHAAALKHVPLAEYNPLECIHTNVYGAENVVLAATRAGVQRVLALSTDKAASPANLYGASKLAAEKIFVAANSLSSRTPTRFSVVRYGNVVSSRGSVIPLFRRLIAEHVRELPITDERMTRFLITLRQSVGFVLSSLAMMEGGEIFIPKIPSVHVRDIARWMAPDLPQRIIGIRPGEKLHEVLLAEHEARSTLELADRFIVMPQFPWWSDDKYKARGGRAIPEGFSYESHTNSEWLNRTAFERLLTH